jgi:hypothetical protein
MGKFIHMFIYILWSLVPRHINTTDVAGGMGRRYMDFIWFGKPFSVYVRSDNGIDKIYYDIYG